MYTLLQNPAKSTEVSIGIPNIGMLLSLKRFQNCGSQNRKKQLVGRKDFSEIGQSDFKNLYCNTTGNYVLIFIHFKAVLRPIFFLQQTPNSGQFGCSHKNPTH